MRKAKLTKKKTRSGKTNNCKSLIDLPDEVLQHILTKLPAKDAAKTSLLSKRFEKLWTSIGVLNIRQNQFKERSLFIKFVDRALLLQNQSSIKMFHLSCDVLSNASSINAWISAIMRTNVEVLHLSLQHLEAQYRLPRCLFNSHSLTSFHLDVPCILNLPLSISFPCLKILRLRHVTFADADSTQQLLSSPVLEELSMFKCVWTVSSIEIHALRQQRLSIDESDYYDQFETYPDIDRDVDLFCSSLKSFYFKGALPSAFYGIYCSSSLVKVTINLEDSIAIGVLHCERIVGILTGMEYVRSLTLMGDCIEAMTSKPWEYRYLPKFGNLTKFKLVGGYINIDASGLIYALSKFSHLKILELVYVTFGFLEWPEDSDSNELILEPMPHCFRSHLKKTIVYCCDSSKYDWLPLATLLNANEALEELIVHWPYERAKEKKGALQQLQNLLKRPEHIRISVLLS